MSVQIFIDSAIPDYELFKLSVKVPIVEFLNGDNEVNRVGFVWENKKTIIPFGQTPYTWEQTSEIIPDHLVTCSSHYFTQEFVDYLLQFQNPITVDLITCSLSTPVFLADLEQIKKVLPNVTFNYSVNLTGNTPQGDWIMESSGEDIKSLYFTDNIGNWTHILALPTSNILGSNFTFTYDGSVSGVRKLTLNQPFTISDANPWTRIDISHNDANIKVVVDGNSHKITVESNNFNGMFIAGNVASNDYATEFVNFNFESTAMYIYNLLCTSKYHIKIDNCKANVKSSLKNTSGCAVFCANVGSSGNYNITIINSFIICDGNINGGISGLFIGWKNNGNIVIDCCYGILNGNIVEQYSGCLFGFGVGWKAGCQITNCYCVFNGQLTYSNSGIFGGTGFCKGSSNLIKNNILIANIKNTNGVGNFISDNYVDYTVNDNLSVVNGQYNYILDLTGVRTNIISPNSKVTSVWTKYTDYSTFISQVNANLRQQTDKFLSINYLLEYYGTQMTFPMLTNLDGYSVTISNITPLFLTQLITIPNAPSNIVGTHAANSVSLTWTAPASNGGDTINNYVIQYSVRNSGVWTTATNVSILGTTATVSGLTTGIEYVFRVAAVNLINNGSNVNTTNYNFNTTYNKRTSVPVFIITKK